MNQWDIPGLAVGVIAEGNVVYAHGFGVRDAENGGSVDTKTLFPVGNCAEPLISLMQCKLRDAGDLDLDSPLAKYLPPQTPGFHDFFEKLTPRDFLCQRSGLPNVGWMRELESRSRAEIVAAMRGMVPAVDWRGGFRDSWLNVVVGEHLVEQVTGRTFEQAVSEAVFDPLGMSGSTWGADALAACNNAVSSHELREGQLHKIQGATVLGAGPVAWLNSNVDDLLRLMKIYTGEVRTDGNVFLNPKSLREMIQPHVFVYWNRSPEYAPTTYGLHWGMNQVGAHYHARLGGFGRGTEALLSFLPGSGIGVVLLANRGGDALTYLTAVKRVIVDHLLGNEPNDWIETAWARIQRRRRDRSSATAVVPTTVVEATALDHFVADYHHELHGELRVFQENGRLMIERGGGLIPLRRTAIDQFFGAKESPWSSLAIDFRRSSQGEVVAIAFEVAGETTVFLRGGAP